MSNLIDFAADEMAVWLSEEADPMDRRAAENVMELIQTFSNQNHSGMSGSWVLSVFERLACFKPISPLTGEDDEWMETPHDIYQNKRCPSVFKGPDGRAYDIEGKVFSNDGGKTWYSSRESKVYIEFPYIVPESPERVYLESEDEE